MLVRWVFRGGLLVLLLALLAQPPVYWRVLGWARVENFYRGRPTSYWRGEVKAMAEREQEFWEAVLSAQNSSQSSPTPDSWWNEWLPSFNSRSGPRVNELCVGDPAVRPVLEALKRDSDPQVRESAGFLVKENLDKIAQRNKR